MSSFRRYGGLNYSANNNITKSYISNAEQMNINNHSGQLNSKETFASHIDMSGNSILHTGTIYFQNGTSINSSVGAQGATGPTGPTGPTGATGPKGDGSWEVVGNDIYYNLGDVIVGNTADTGNIYADNYYLNNKPLNPLYPGVPAVTFGTVYQGSTSIYVIIDYAAANQIYFPNSGIPIPAISACSFDISYTYNGLTQTEHLVTYTNSQNFNSNYVLPIATTYPAPPLPTVLTTEKYLTGIVITKNAAPITTNNPTNIQFPNTITYNAVVFNTYSYPDAYDFTITGTYYNYTDNSTPITTTTYSYTTSYAPTSDAYFNSTSSSTTTNVSPPNSNLILTYKPPTSVVTQGSPDGVSLTSFTTTLSTQGDTNNYNGTTSQNQTVTNDYTQPYPYTNTQNVTYGYGGTGANNPLTLYPSCDYYFTDLTSTNSNGSTSDPTPGPSPATPTIYGPYTTQTLNINSGLLTGSTPTNISSSSSLISTPPIQSAYFVSNSTSVSNLYNNIPIGSNTFGPYSINYDKSSIGKLGQGINLMDISLSVTGQNNLSTTTINSTGFPLTTNPTITQQDITISSLLAIDQYSLAGFTGYYLQLPSFSATISNSKLTATNNPYTFSITQTYYDLSTNTVGNYNAQQQFYYDNYTSSPSINANGTLTINNNNNTYYSTLVSGISVLSSSPTFTLTGLSLNDMGDYFYVKPFVTYTFSQGCTGIVKETNLNNVTNLSGETLPSTLNITNINISPTTISPSYNNSIALSITLTNVYTTVSNISTPTLNVIVDVPSFTFLNNIKTLKNLSSTTALGYRVWSAPADYGESMNPSGLVPFVFIQANSPIPNNSQTGSTPATTPQGYISVPYNNIWNISSTSNSTNEELLIANGNFTTDNTYYLNYSTYSGNVNLNTGIDYSGLENTGLNGTKFATFAWNTGTITSSPTLLNFTINFTGSLYENPQSSFYYFDSNNTQQLLLYYRFEYTNNVTSNSWNGQTSTTTVYPNTAWISINSITSSNLNTIKTNEICVYANATNVYYYKASYPVINSGYNYTFQTDLPGISLNNATLYLRVGLPNNLTTNSFNNVSAFLS